MAKPERTMLAIGGGVLAIVIVAIVVAITLGSSATAEYPPDSPEGTLQRYLQAAYEGDTEEVEALLSERAKQESSVGKPGAGPICYPQDGRRVDITRVDRDGERATIHLSIEQVSGSGLSFDRYSYESQVRLVQEDGAWKIDDPYFCA